MAYADAEDWGRRGLDDSSYADYVEGWLDDGCYRVAPTSSDRYWPFQPVDCGHGLDVVRGCDGCPPF